MQATLPLCPLWWDKMLSVIVMGNPNVHIAWFWTNARGKRKSRVLVSLGNIGHVIKIMKQVGKQPEW